MDTRTSTSVEHKRLRLTRGAMLDALDLAIDLQLFDAAELTVLHARQLRESLPPDDLTRANALEGREAARKFCEAVYSAMGADNAIYDALEPVRDGLVLATHGTAADRVAGYTMGLRAMLDEPDALIAAVRVLVTKLEADHD